MIFEIVLPLIELAFLSIIATIPFAYAALAIETCHNKLQNTRPLLAPLATIPLSLAWLALLFLVALFFANYWRFFLGI